MNLTDDICGLCGEPGADKFKHPVHWPGEQDPEGDLVHAECEEEECKRAHADLSDKQREVFLRTIGTSVDKDFSTRYIKFIAPQERTIK